MEYDQAMFLFGGSGRVIRQMQPMPGLPPQEEQQDNSKNKDQENQ